MTEAIKSKGTGLLGLMWMLGALVPAQAQSTTEVVLHNFAPTTGAYPVVGVIGDSAGNLYGTATVGGTSGQGVVYKLDSAGQYSVLFNFTGGADGGQPYAGVIGDSAGNLYGTTSAGGAANAGVVYKLDRSGQETVLYSFTGGADGFEPLAGLIRDPAGNLYGTAT
ncbi:MAG TPA: choice-of-anchor tandem repeat GloVer-containing protein, partial [Bryobacteraceae bacterium]|nr:choice-of-anchor tandem repeat GloVer-containing protein [Bryobacteraceae bacterium]